MDRDENPARLNDATDDSEQPVTAVVRSHRRSDVTGRHDAGSGANETIDGLDSTTEAIRQGAEDTPIGAHERREDVPVFDRGDSLPKI